jgi:predicted RNA-binding Zn ribbon-like protein
MRTVQTRPQPEYEFDLSGRNLCLDFANTVSRRDDPRQTREHLASPVDLIAFARQSALITAKHAAELRLYAQHHPREAGHVYQQAIILREHVFSAFAAISQGGEAGENDLRAISHAAQEALQHRHLQRAGKTYRWEWEGKEANPLGQLLWPLAQAVADLLTSDQLKLVRFCEAADCQWLFLDHSRNRSRRWCDMTICGNREKARRHYQRTHVEAG